MKYKVLTNLTHDGMVYPAGSEVELDKATATGLLNDGIVSDQQEVKPEPMQRSGKPETEKEKKAREKAEKDAADEKAKADAAAVVAKYRVLKAFELPEGVTNEVDAIIEITVGQAAELKKGTVELVEDGTDDANL